MKQLQKKMYRGFLFAIVASGLLLLSCNGTPELPDFTTSNTGPYLINIDHLVLIDSLKNEDPVLSRAYQILETGADSLLTAPFSYVTDKKHDSPSGDPHDYVSLHRYSYYNPETEKYDIIKDGRVNPEFYEYDKPRLEKLSASVYTLSLAYYYTKQEKYAQKASELVENWFLNPDTRMNPNMKYSSIQPGIYEGGAGSGIVGAIDFINVIEGVSLLYDSMYWTSESHYKLKAWFYEFYRWIFNNYPPDAYSETNIATWLDVQRGVYLLFTEQGDKLGSSSHIQPVARRMEDQIQQNGILTYEANRGIPQSYVYFNLKAYMNLSTLRKNYYERKGNDRDWPVLSNCMINNCEFGGLKLSLDNIASFLTDKNEASLFATEPGFDSCRYLEIFQPAAVAFSDPEYERTAQNLISQNCFNSNILLTYPSLHHLQ